jgi:hypothetical protein
MLGDKDRMPAHWGLLAVVDGHGRRQTTGNEIRGVLIDSFRPFVPAVLPLFRAQFEARTKG